MKEVFSTDIELLQAIKQGDELALQTLLYKYRPKMLMEAYYVLRDMDEAEDVLQEIFISFWKLRDAIKIQSDSLAPYLLRASRYESVIRLKKHKTRNKRQDQFNYFIETTTLPKPFENAELAAAIEKALENIPPAARKSFTMLYIDGLSQKDIAAEQNISLQVVKNNVSKALKILRGILHNVKLF
jgi:RNA polymerase sigma-70 factor, ECF subfamily